MADFTVRPKRRYKKERFFKRVFDYTIPQKGDAVREIIRKIIFDTALIAFIIAGGSLLYDIGNEIWQKFFVNNSILSLKGGLNIDDESREPNGILSKYASAYAINNDLVGWVKIDGTVIDYPVCQSDDNDYYLSHDFYGNSAERGTIFADYRNVFTPTETSDNTILYGHNIWTGDMFAILSRYYYPKDEPDDLCSFYREHPIVDFDTIYEVGKYKVFACVIFNTEESLGEVYNYTGKREFSSKAKFNTFISDIMERSVIWTDTDIDYGDPILTLSTCYWLNDEKSTRCVVFARKIRDGESEDCNVEAATRNPNVRMYQYDYGDDWYSTWDRSLLLSLDD